MARYAPSNPVALFEPQRALVLGHIKDSDAELAAGQARSSWAFILQPLNQHSTRLLVRCRGTSLMARLQGPVQFVMQRKMMLDIKQRAERSLPSATDDGQRRPDLSGEPRDLLRDGRGKGAQEGNQQAVMARPTQPTPTDTAEPRLAPTAGQASVELHWLPLGAGGWFVRLNGRIWEAAHALLERRRPLDLYHTALQVHLPEGHFVIENSWPIPAGDGLSRGVVVQGPVASRRLARWRVFRYEVRRWRDGVIADADAAVASPQRLSDDPLLTRCLLELVASLPSPVWGRDELGTGEMWNSNSVIAWLLTRSGLPTDQIRPPAGGRAPGWKAGIITARCQQQCEVQAGHRAGDARTRVGSSNGRSSAAA